MEPLCQEERQVVAHERTKLLHRRERAVGGASFLLDPTNERDEAILALERRLLDVEEHRLALTEVELILEARNRAPLGNPAVALPVDADKNIALIDVCRVQVTRCVRTRTLLEQHRSEVQRRDRLACGDTLLCELAQWRGNEDPQTAIR